MTTIVAISDTHSYHRNIIVPDGDILVHAGDITWRGELEIIADFCNWWKELPHKNKIIVCGNHELGIRNEQKRNIALQMFDDTGSFYLEDKSARINNFYFYGSPWQPAFHDWEWNLPRNGDELSQKWDMIPEDTNILITHCPPYGILDDTIQAGSQGCELLAKRLPQLTNLKVHIFGHLHRDGGKMVERDGVKFINAAVCTDYYKPENLPVVVEV
jgi:Icc-related predicted phosphoesterase